MVAQQILVLFVLVRIQVEQHLKFVLTILWRLFYGVMVAQQILVRFVRVRIQVEQHKKASLFDKSSEAFYVMDIVFLFVTKPFEHLLYTGLLTIHDDWRGEADHGAPES